LAFWFVETLGDVVVRGVLVFVLAAFGGLAFALADANSSVTYRSAQKQSRDHSQAQVNIASLAPQQTTIPSPASIEPFGLDTTPVVTGELLANWAGVQAAIRDDREVLARCREVTKPCPAAAQRFLDIVATGRARAGRARIGVINRAINLAIRPRRDVYWSPPLATLAIGAGDCKDYAIAKYFALREAGVAADDVRLVIVRNLDVGEDHAVVSVRLDGAWTILDNRSQVLVEDTKMQRVIPLFVLDQQGVEQFAMRVARQAPPPVK
jgi:predicted transglutaminase-like cysteine proteinase